MLTFMGENKRLLNIHEQKFVDLAAFQENTVVFQANTNAFLKNLELQVGKFPSYAESVHGCISK